MVYQYFGFNSVTFGLQVLAQTRQMTKNTELEVSLFAAISGTPG
jgi:hypothetical protein